MDTNKQLIIKIPKTKELEDLRFQASFEMAMIKEYHKSKIAACLLIDFCILIPALLMGYNLIDHTVIVLSLVGIALSLNLYAHYKITKYCTDKIKEKNIGIDENWQSLTADKYSNQLNELVKQELRKQKIYQYYVSHVEFEKEFYVCTVINKN